jgi:hypothetical protein
MTVAFLSAKPTCAQAHLMAERTRSRAGGALRR